MALVLNDRVKETSTTTGTGTFSLGGAVDGFETFVAGIANGNTTYYAAVNRDADEFEVGIGTVTDASPDTLARTTIISSSNSDSAVDFSAGTKDIFTTLPASKAIFEDASDDVTVGNDLILGSDSAVLKFGADSDTTLTHTDGTGLTLNSTNKLLFRDSALYINSSTDGQLDIVADTEVQIAATTIDINGAVALNGAITGATNITLSGELDAATLDISGDADIDGTLEADAITINGATLAETVTDLVGGMVSSNTETGITVTFQDADNTLDFALGAAQTTITSLLATDIKIGEDDQTKIDFETADEIHFYAANVEQVYLGDNIFGPQSDSDVDLGSTGVRWKDAFVDSITVTGEIDGASLDISGNADIDGTLETDALSIASTTVTSTAAEINLIDGGTSRGTTAVASGDGILINDDGTMRMTNVDTVSTYFAGHSVGGSNIVTTGALDSGSITSGFGNIDNGASNITSGGLVKLDVDADADDLTGDSATGRLTIGAGEDLNLYHGGSNSYIVNDTGDLIIDTAGDISLDTGGDDFKFLASGTHIFSITNSSSDVVLKPKVDAKDIIFQQRDGTEVARIEDNATFNVSSAGKFAYAGTAVTSTAAELNYSDLATLGTSAASKVLSADANNLTKITGAVYLEEDTLSFDATQDWDVRASPVAKVTLTNNVTFDAPTNPTTGQYIAIVCIQDGTGSRTIAWNAVFEFKDDTAPTATTTANKGDLFTFRYNGAKWLEVGRNLNLTLS